MDIKASILDLLGQVSEISSTEILHIISNQKSIATVKRALSSLVSEGLVITSGKGRSTRYRLSPQYNLIRDINIEAYYRYEIDDRDIIADFSFSLIDELLPDATLFNDDEKGRLDELQSKFLKNISQMSQTEKAKELERLAIDLSWKSSQIEGNTYSLLETERLIKEKQTASGKTKEEAIMLLNHKEAIDFIIDNPKYLSTLSVAKIENIHGILVKELGVDKNIRRRKVGISGTNYRPLDNEFQIREILEKCCALINKKEDAFEKALLSLMLISYIQPFADGNKRTARIISNAILLQHNHCPISFRTVDSMDYKKAMLLFYEQNNISAFKKIFIEQYEFAVNTYF